MQFHFLRGTSGDFAGNPITYKNPAQEDPRYRANPSYPFFYISNEPFKDKDVASAESYAIQSSSQTGKKPLVLRFEIDEKDIEPYIQRFFRLRRDPATNRFDEVPISNTQELMASSQILINGEGLKPQDFKKINLEIGSGEKEGSFEYEKYQPLSINEGGISSLEAAG